MKRPLFLGKKLLFVVAHPDDETFLAAGTMLANHDMGGKNVIVCATCGEKGKSHLDKPISAQRLKQLRKSELVKVSKYLKADRLIVMNLPDTRVAQNKPTFQYRVSKIIKQTGPDFIISFGRDGITGHLDHIAAGEVALRLAKAFKISFAAFSPTPSFKRRTQYFIARRKHGKYAEKIEYAKPTVRIQVDPKKKFKAIAFHRSQHDGGVPMKDFPHQVKEDILSYEYYVS